MTVMFGVSAFGADWQPVASVRLLGGQHAFRGERVSVSGNASVRAAIAAVLGPQWSLLGSFDSEYEGTKPLSQPVGPGTLFQQRMTHAIGLKPVFAPKKSRWRFKPSIRYRMEFLKETRDESWNRGLFDSQSATLGFEAELPYRDKYELRLGFDYAFVRFPRYQSLESRSRYDFNGAVLARELVGDNVLNYTSQTLYSALSAPLPREARLDVSLSFERKRFGSQPVVKGDGLLTGQSRIDLVTRAAGRVSLGRELRRDIRLAGGLGLSAATTISNQNRYDAGQGVYSSRYYNQFEIGVSPRLGLELGDDRRPATLSLEPSWTRRTWGQRSVQASSGRYLSETVHQTVWGVSLRVNYPLGTRLRFLGEIETAAASSNQGFEQFYRYNYGSFSLLTGLGLDF